MMVLQHISPYCGRGCSLIIWVLFGEQYSNLHEMIRFVCSLKQHWKYIFPNVQQWNGIFSQTQIFKSLYCCNLMVYPFIRPHNLTQFITICEMELQKYRDFKYRVCGKHIVFNLVCLSKLAPKQPICSEFFVKTS